MGDEPSGDVAHAEIVELDALRRRAYGPDADIFDDPGGLGRLEELEERVRRERFPLTVPSPPSPTAEPRTAAPGGAAVAHPESAAAVPIAPDAAAVAARRRRAPRWHGALVAAAAVVAVLLGGAAWSADRIAAGQSLAEGDARIAATVDEHREASYRASYRLYIDGLREEVLTLAGAEGIAERMIRDQLRPHGLLYGRTVGVGPTRDHRFCMIIADLPDASITCIPVENAYANPVTVVLPAWYTEADSDLFTGLGAPVAYTLMPGGIVIAEPADSADSLYLPDAAAPAATAVPPPGWQ